jgi:heme-degrading monooxygenase HmoA
MFIAMNRFKVIKGSEAAFETVWLSRDSHLDKVPGFVEFHLLKGPEAEDHTLYASHTVWKNRATFEAWTRSEAFRAAHHKAGDTSRSILDTRSSKDSRLFRRWEAAKALWREAHADDMSVRYAT